MKIFLYPYRVLLLFLLSLNGIELKSQCSNNYEPNNSSSAATNLFSPNLGGAPKTITITSLKTYDDQDWYLVGIDGPGYLTINLTNLPSDYDMELYGIGGLSEFIDKSYNTGTSSENISNSFLVFGSTVRYIKIYGKTLSNYNNSLCYTLSVSWKPCTFFNQTPSLISPGTSSSPGTTITTLTPTLDWTDVSGANSYGVFIRDMFTNTLVYSNGCATTTSQFKIPDGTLVSSRTYRWNVQANYDCGECKSLFPSAIYFTTSNCLAPTQPAYNIKFTDVKSNQVTVTWTNGNGSRRVVKINNLLQFSVVPDGTDPSASTIYDGSFNQVVYNGSGSSVTITGLQANTGYWFNVTEANCTGTSSVYANLGSNENPALVVTASVSCSSPTKQSNSIIFSNVNGNSFTVNWTNGNGSKRIVKINTINSFTAPTDGVDPVANSNFLNNGEQFIYNGTNSSVNVTGLLSNTEYWVRVYEANCNDNTIVYNTNTATTNPANQTTTSNVVPVADFTSNKTIISVGQSVQITDLSTNNPIIWGWKVKRIKLSGGTTLYTSATVKNPLFSFYSPGCYTIELMAANASGSDIEEKTCFIYVKPNSSAPVNPDAAMSLLYETYFGGDPVNTALGFFSFQQKDISTKGILNEASIERRFTSRLTYVSQFGRGWYFDYGIRVNVLDFQATLCKGDGSMEEFALYPNGETRSMSPVFNDSLYYLNDGGIFSYTYIEKSGIKWNFDNNGLLRSKIDLNGNVTQVLRNGDFINKLILPGGRELNFTYNNRNISSITNGIDTCFYYYNATGVLLDSVKIRNSRTWYKYNAANQLEEIISPNNFRIIKNEYFEEKVIKQWDAFNNLTEFQYNTPGNTSTTIINPKGKSKIVTHDPSFKITEQINEKGQKRRYVYTDEHRLDSIIDERGNKYKFFENSAGDIYKTIDPLNNADSLSFTNYGRPVFIKDKEGNITTITYTDKFKPNLTILPNNGTYSIEYDQYGQDIRITDPLNNQVLKTYNEYGDLFRIQKKYTSSTFVYDAIGRPIVHFNAKGAKDSIFYNHYNQPVRVVDALKYSESFEYDANGNLVKHTDKEGILTVLTYDAKDRLLRVEKSGLLLNEYIWDELDFLVRIRDGNKNCSIITNDELGRPITIADSVLGIVAEYGYDATGNRVLHKNSLGKSWLSSFDELNRYTGTTDPNGNTATVKYNKNGLPTEYIDASAKSVKLEYNSLGQHIKTIDKSGNSIQRFLDKVGQPDSIRDARGFYRRYSYDEDNRLKTYDEGYGTHYFTYDEANNLTEYKDAASNIITWEFNARNERVSEKWNGALAKQFSYNKNGQLTFGSNQTNNHYRFYNNLGWLIKDSSSYGGAVFYEKDKVGNTIKVTLKDGKQVVNTFNSLNYCTSVAGWNNQVVQLNRNNEGDITAFVYPNGLRTDIDRNNAYEVTAWVNKKTNPTPIIFQKNNPVYDNLGRIVSDTSTINYFPQSLTPGNISATYGKADRRQTYGTNSFVYNGNGSVTGINGPAITNSYTYNADNSTAAVNHIGTSFTNQYNLFGHRVEKNNGVQQTLYTLGYGFAQYPVVLQEENSANATPVTNLFSPGGLLLGRDSAGVFRYYHYNAYGNTTALSDASGTITDTYAYSLFGNITTHTGNNMQPYTWQGMYGVQKDANELYYMWHRYYDANTGSFLSKDPIQGPLTETRNLNPYLYALNDPLSFNDPIGLYPRNVVNNYNYYEDIVNDNSLSFWEKTKRIWNNSWNEGLNKLSKTLKDPQTWELSFEIAMFLVPEDYLLTKSETILDFTNLARKNETVIHHIASNKHLTKYTSQFEAIAAKYGLKLDAEWNKVEVSTQYHYSKHPGQYHEFVLAGMRAADMGANGNQMFFLKLFDQYVKQPLLQNLDILNLKGW